jgi:hypothetical protein
MNPVNHPHRRRRAMSIGKPRPLHLGKTALGIKLVNGKIKVIFVYSSFTLIDFLNYLFKKFHISWYIYKIKIKGRSVIERTLIAYHLLSRLMR